MLGDQPRICQQRLLRTRIDHQ